MLKKKDIAKLNMNNYEALAYQLANDDTFRSRFQDDPKGCLKNAGAPLNIINACPDTIRLPEKGVIARKLDQMRSQMQPQKRPEAAERPHKFW